MNNQYVGDIGDYSKLAILTRIVNAGLTLGVNWYLTPDENEQTVVNKSEGVFRFLSKPCDTPDKELFDYLNQIVDSDARNISSLEQYKLLDGVLFWNKMLHYSQWEDRRTARLDWHQNALLYLSSKDIVFLDPDNGLEVKSTSPFSKNGNKFTTYDEACDYFAQGMSVVLYNHRDRSPEAKYVQRLTRFQSMTQTEGAKLLCLTAWRQSVRDYLFILQPNHYEKLKPSLDALLLTGWGNYLKVRTL